MFSLDSRQPLEVMNEGSIIVDEMLHLHPQQVIFQKKFDIFQQIDFSFFLGSKAQHNKEFRNFIGDAMSV